MMALTVVMMALIYLALRLMLYGSPQAFTAGQMLMAVPIGMALGLQGAMVVEIFPLRTRVTSMSFAYSITLALAGGTAPLVSTWLIETLGQPLAPAYYIMLYGAIGLAIMWPMRETNRAPSTSSERRGLGIRDLGTRDSRDINSGQVGSGPVRPACLWIATGHCC